MPDINIVDWNINQFKDQIELSIQAGLGSFSFCISTSSDNTIRAFRHYSFSNAVLQEDILNHTNEILRKDELLRMPFKKTRVIFVSRKSTLVPNEFFKPELLKKLLEFNQPVGELDEIHFNAIDFCDAKHTFALPTYFAGMFADRFNKVTFYNQATPMLLLLNEIAREDTSHTVIINLNNEFFDIAVMQDKHLKFYNNFLYVNSTDLLYFILYVCQQLEINKEAANFYLTGEQRDKRDLVGEISGYLKNLRTIEQIRDIRFIAALQKIDQSRFATLLNLVKCV
jgi:hypothetical protein